MNIANWYLLMLSSFGENTITKPEYDLPPWLKFMSAIVTLLGLILGIPYGISLWKKTKIESEKAKTEIDKNRLESQKIKLEITEKLKGLGKLSSVDIEHLLAPSLTGESKPIGYLLLRFIILYIFLIGWGLIQEGIRFLGAGIIYGMGWIFSMQDPEDTVPGRIVSIPLILIIEYGYWVLFLLMGVPLLMDIKKYLGLKIGDFFAVPFYKRNNKK